MKSSKEAWRSRPKGRALYDQCLSARDFSDFPDDLERLKSEKLAYFDRSDTPLTYEDFLPVSAAGIFRSNLGETGSSTPQKASGNQAIFEAALGRPILNMFDLYARFAT